MFEATVLKSGGGGAVGLLLPGLLAARRAFRHRQAVGTAALLLLGSSANAAGPWYIGGQLGHARTDVSSSEVSQRLAEEGISASANAAVSKENRTGYRAFAGYQWNKTFSIEGGYTDLNEITTRFSGLPDGITARDLHRVRPGPGYGIELALLAGYDISDQVRGFGRVGLMHWRAEHNINGSRYDVYGTDPVLG